MITNEDLLKELSEKELIELSDLKHSFTLNQDIVDDAINDAESFIASFIKIPAEPTPLLKQICTLLTIIELKRKQNFPKDSYKEELDYCEKTLFKMAGGKIPTQISELSNAPKATSRAFVHGGDLGDWEGING